MDEPEWIYAGFEEGRRAYRDGIKIGRNPYHCNDDPYNDWERGWLYEARVNTKAATGIDKSNSATVHRLHAEGVTSYEDALALALELLDREMSVVITRRDGLRGDFRYEVDALTGNLSVLYKGDRNG